MLDIITGAIAANPETVATLLSVVISGLAGWLISILERRTGIKVSAAREEKIKRAIHTGIVAYLESRGMDADTAPPNTPDTRNAAIEAAVTHAMTDGAGDTVRKLKASSDALRRVARAQLNELLRAR